MVKKCIDQFTLEGDYIQSFESIAMASKYVGRDPAAIRLACIGKCFQSGGYRWSFSNSEIDSLRGTDNDDNNKWKEIEI